MKRSGLVALALLISVSAFAKDPFDWPTHLHGRAPEAFESCKSYLLANLNDGYVHAPLVSQKVNLELLTNRISFDPFDLNATSVGGRFIRDRLSITMGVTGQARLNAYHYNLVCDVRLKYDKANGDWPPQIMSITDIREQ